MFKYENRWSKIRVQLSLGTRAGGYLQLSPIFVRRAVTVDASSNWEGVPTVYFFRLRQS